MARKPTVRVEKKPIELSVSREEAKTRLQERIEKGLELRNKQIGTAQGFELLTNDYQKWNAYNTEMLRRIFTTEEFIDEYEGFPSLYFGMEEPSLGEQIADLYKGIDGKIHRIDSIIERLELIPLSSILQAASMVNQQSTAQSRSKKVFVVHGRDEVAKTNLEVFLHEVGLEPVVLHRQADEGMTIIEKFEKHSDVGYTFILLTPDEVAYLASEEATADEARKKEYRARPNVIFEFGYFVGKLGRSRVCCLYTGDVTLPSDVNGMIYKRYNQSIDEVAYSLSKDLKASGYTIA